MKNKKTILTLLQILFILKFLRIVSPECTINCNKPSYKNHITLTNSPNIFLESCRELSCENTNCNEHSGDLDPQINEGCCEIVTDPGYVIQENNEEKYRKSVNCQNGNTVDMQNTDIEIDVVECFRNKAIEKIDSCTKGTDVSNSVVTNCTVTLKTNYVFENGSNDPKKVVCNNGNSIVGNTEIFNSCSLPSNLRLIFLDYTKTKCNNLLLASNKEPFGTCDLHIKPYLKFSSTDNPSNKNTNISFSCKDNGTNDYAKTNKIICEADENSICEIENSFCKITCHEGYKIKNENENIDTKTYANCEIPMNFECEQLKCSLPITNNDFKENYSVTQQECISSGLMIKSCTFTAKPGYQLEKGEDKTSEITSKCIISSGAIVADKNFTIFAIRCFRKKAIDRIDSCTKGTDVSNSVVTNCTVTLKTNYVFENGSRDPKKVVCNNGNSIVGNTEILNSCSLPSNLPLVFLDNTKTECNNLKLASNTVLFGTCDLHIKPKLKFSSTDDPSNKNINISFSCKDNGKNDYAKTNKIICEADENSICEIENTACKITCHEGYKIKNENQNIDTKTYANCEIPMNFECEQLKCSLPITNNEFREKYSVTQNECISSDLMIKSCTFTAKPGYQLEKGVDKTSELISKCIISSGAIVADKNFAIIPIQCELTLSNLERIDFDVKNSCKKSDNKIVVNGECVLKTEKAFIYTDSSNTVTMTCLSTTTTSPDEVTIEPIDCGLNKEVLSNNHHFSLLTENCIDKSLDNICKADCKDGYYSTTTIIDKIEIFCDVDKKSNNDRVVETTHKCVPIQCKFPVADDDIIHVNFTKSICGSKTLHQDDKPSGQCEIFTNLGYIFLMNGNQHESISFQCIGESQSNVTGVSVAFQGCQLSITNPDSLKLDETAIIAKGDCNVSNEIITLVKNCEITATELYSLSSEKNTLVTKSFLLRNCIDDKGMKLSIGKNKCTIPFKNENFEEKINFSNCDIIHESGSSKKFKGICNFKAVEPYFLLEKYNNLKSYEGTISCLINNKIKNNKFFEILPDICQVNFIYEMEGDFKNFVKLSCSVNEGLESRIKVENTMEFTKNCTINSKKGYSVNSVAHLNVTCDKGHPDIADVTITQNKCNLNVLKANKIDGELFNYEQKNCQIEKMKNSFQITSSCNLSSNEEYSLVDEKNKIYVEKEVHCDSLGEMIPHMKLKLKICSLPKNDLVRYDKSCNKLLSGHSCTFECIENYQHKNKTKGNITCKVDASGEQSLNLPNCTEITNSQKGIATTPQNKTNWLIIVLSIVGAILVVAIIGVVIMFKMKVLCFKEEGTKNKISDCSLQLDDLIVLNDH